MITFGFKSYPVTWRPVSNPPDGRNWSYDEPLVYQCKDGRLIRGRGKSTTDGISTPPIIWNIIPPTGPYFCSGVLHDSGYRGTCEIFDAELQKWLPYEADENTFDLIILEALESQGCNWIERETIYKALCFAGSRAFTEDRANIPQVTITDIKP